MGPHQENLMFTAHSSASCIRNVSSVKRYFRCSGNKLVKRMVVLLLNTGTVLESSSLLILPFTCSFLAKALSRHSVVELRFVTLVHKLFYP